MADNGTKLCKHCQSEIPKKAKVCPNCRKKQGLGCLPTGLIILAVLIVIGMIFGSGNDDKSDSNSANQAASQATVESGADKTEQPQESQEPEEKEITTQAEEQKENVVKKGGSFEAKGLKITVDDIDTNYEVENNDYGIYDLDEGYKYISASFTFENTGDRDAYVSISDFDCYADNKNCEQKYLTDGDDFINTNLSAGRQVSFTTYYAVPDDADDIELEYTSNFWTDEKVIIKVK